MLRRICIAKITCLKEKDNIYEQGVVPFHFYYKLRTVQQLVQLVQHERRNIIRISSRDLKEIAKIYKYQRNNVLSFNFHVILRCI